MTEGVALDRQKSRNYLRGQELILWYIVKMATVLRENSAIELYHSCTGHQL